MLLPGRVAALYYLAFLGVILPLIWYNKHTAIQRYDHVVAPAILVMLVLLLLRTIVVFKISWLSDTVRELRHPIGQAVFPMLLLILLLPIWLAADPHRPLHTYTTILSITPDYTHGYSSECSMSSDGRYVLFQSDIIDLSSKHIFLYNTAADTARRIVIQGVPESPAGYTVIHPYLSSDGNHITCLAKTIYNGKLAALRYHIASARSQLIMTDCSKNGTIRLPHEVYPVRDGSMYYLRGLDHASRSYCHRVNFNTGSIDDLSLTLLASENIIGFSQDGKQVLITTSTETDEYGYAILTIESARIEPVQFPEDSTPLAASPDLNSVVVHQQKEMPWYSYDSRGNFTGDEDERVLNSIMLFDPKSSTSRQLIGWFCDYFWSDIPMQWSDYMLLKGYPSYVMSSNLDSIAFLSRHYDVPDRQENAGNGLVLFDHLENVFGHDAQLFLLSKGNRKPKLISHAWNSHSYSNARCYTPSISDDGRFIAYYSDADDLVEIDLNGNISDVFLYDTATGQNKLISKPNDWPWYVRTAAWMLLLSPWLLLLRRPQQ